MNRRSFMLASLSSCLAPAVPKMVRAESPGGLSGARPLPAITAVVDCIMPADPDVPGDFKGSDYGADRFVAERMGFWGQSYAAFLLNKYALQRKWKIFVLCSPADREEVFLHWARRRDELPAMERDVLEGLVALTLAGTFEGHPPEVQRPLYASMGWFDPRDPENTLQIPCEGYPKLAQFPGKR